MSSAAASASSAVSANFTPPAFIRPPVSTCDLITTGPPTSAATCLACSALAAKPPPATGMPSRSRIWRDSYSKKRTAAGHPTAPHLVTTAASGVREAPACHRDELPAVRAGPQHEPEDAEGVVVEHLAVGGGGGGLGMLRVAAGSRHELADPAGV